MWYRNPNGREARFHKRLMHSAFLAGDLSTSIEIRLANYFNSMQYPDAFDVESLDQLRALEPALVAQLRLVGGTVRTSRLTFTVSAAGRLVASLPLDDPSIQTEPCL